MSGSSWAGEVVDLVDLKFNRLLIGYEIKHVVNDSSNLQSHHVEEVRSLETAISRQHCFFDW